MSRKKKSKSDTLVSMCRAIIFLLICITSLHANVVKKTTSVVILGEGIAGMSAALQISQAGLTPLVITGPSPGGIITVSTEVENWPGDFSITGAQLADRLEQQIEKRGVELLSGIVTKVDFSKRPFVIYATNPLVKNDSFEIEAECCIVTLGATPNLLQTPGELPLLYRKIFTCAPCDGLRFKDQTVAVVGGGEAALVEAHYLANLARKVFVVVRGDAFKSFQPALKEKLFSKPNVEILYQTTVEQFEDHPQGIELKLKKGKSIEPLLVQGVFLAIGSTPNTQRLKGSIDLDSKGYIILKEGQETSIPGVFAAGDVSDPTYNQAVTAAGDATKAALKAIRFLSEKNSSSARSSAPLSAAEVTEISDLPTLQSAIRASGKPTLLYFYSPSCMPCRAFKPLYLRWAQEYNEVAVFLKVNGEACPACVNAYQIQGIPTVLILDSEGHILRRETGATHMTPILMFLEEQKKIKT